jgi:hypothetical protein
MWKISAICAMKLRNTLDQQILSIPAGFADVKFCLLMEAYRKKYAKYMPII